MKNNKIEKALKEAATSAPLIPVDEMFAKPFIKMSEHDYITRQEEVRKTSFLKRYNAVITCCLIVLVFVAGWYVRGIAPDSVITLDVNPSIEIKTNRNDKVLSVTALNQDAQEIIGASRYSNQKLEDTLVSIINSLVEHNYINAEKRTILLTVMNKDNQKADDLLSRMNFVITDDLSTLKITPTIMNLAINNESDISKLAKSNHVSEGKLKLMQDIIAANPSLSIESLADTSVEDLLEIAEENQVDLNKFKFLEGIDAYDKENNESSEGKEEEAYEKQKNGDEEVNELEEGSSDNEFEEQEDGQNEADNEQEEQESKEQEGYDNDGDQDNEDQYDNDEDQEGQKSHREDSVDQKDAGDNEQDSKEVSGSKIKKEDYHKQGSLEDSNHEDRNQEDRNQEDSDHEEGNYEGGKDIPAEESSIEEESSFNSENNNQEDSDQGNGEVIINQNNTQSEQDSPDSYDEIKEDQTDSISSDETENNTDAESNLESDTNNTMDEEETQYNN